MKVKVRKRAKRKYNPVAVVYDLLINCRDSGMSPDGGVIEEMIGYLGEALA